MTVVRRAALAALAVASLAAGCADGARQSTAEAEMPDVPEFLVSYAEAIAARDTATLRGMYAEDDRFVWIEDGEVRYQSAADVFTSLAAFDPNAAIETEFEDTGTVTLTGGPVHAWARFTTTVSGAGGGYSFGGLMSFVLEPAAGGWRIVVGHVSSPRIRGQGTPGDGEP